ncbi:sulfite exporter TauE/SafE family protein [Neptuniibacter caesariensis]|uniref:Probable membrane transporter protein n=1 Tax=Neptuniibacter caesariensis TaxID=207954 RepID=A0A7U8C9Z6_NEPCE|nr:sulfite exporter TauE/SafE family protein [Neptuniibacter caesariensis]EAR62840.1 putative membrane protein [Oceanospirillum sp. MED92] [Neptuniibacter caesariensis]
MPLQDNLELALFLIFSAAGTSFITAAMGIGGGVLLLAILASVLPPAALIPVHGLVQLGSNGNRAIMTRQHIDWCMVKSFTAGALIGAFVASFVVIQLPLYLIQLCVALFILFLVWGPKPKKHQMSEKGQVAAGAGTTFISMFVGATGPLVAGFVHRQSYEKLTTTATFAACMSFQHLLKMLVFSLVGFAFWQWLPLVILMVLGGMAGTWLGLRMLNKIPTQHFRIIFKTVITLMAVRLLWQASQVFFA